jgi:hypothetical protein
MAAENTPGYIYTYLQLEFIMQAKGNGFSIQSLNVASYAGKSFCSNTIEVIIVNQWKIKTWHNKFYVASESQIIQPPTAIVGQTESETRIPVQCSLNRHHYPFMLTAYVISTKYSCN